MEPVKTAAGGRGAKMTYRFADITKLQLSPGSGMKNLSPMGAPDADAGPKSTPIRFAYSGGTLTLKMPPPDAAKPQADTPAAGGPDMDNPQAMEMMKKMMGDMKMSLRIVAPGGIAETNATFRDDKTVTLVEMDMGKIIEQPDAMKKLNSADRNDPQAAMAALKGMAGVKLEMKEEIRITLK